jgi:hypothetical protein
VIWKAWLIIQGARLFCISVEIKLLMEKRDEFQEFCQNSKKNGQNTKNASLT